MSRTRRRPFTLIEVMISLAIASTLIIAVLSVYFQLSNSAKTWEKKRTELIAERTLHFRLSEVFSALIVNNHFRVDSVNGTHYKEGSLIFCYDRGVDLRPEFSGPLLARLYLDNENRIVLSSWPMPKRINNPAPEFRLDEVLATDIKELSFDIYSPSPSRPAIITLSLKKDERLDKVAYTIPTTFPTLEVEE